MLSVKAGTECDRALGEVVIQIVFNITFALTYFQQHYKKMQCLYHSFELINVVVYRCFRDSQYIG